MSDPAKAIFISYARDDTDAARRIAEALRSHGVEVWFDQNELRGGDVWDQNIRNQIRTCTLFLPVISGVTQERREGYFRREWKLGVERTHDLADGVPFIVPVVIDYTAESAAAVPAEFLRVQWTRLPGALPTPDFVAQVKRLLKPPRQPAAGSVHPLPPPAVASPAPATSPKSIAVLPFANMSADAENEYFSDGMTEEIINALVQVPGLQVAARTSVFAFKGKADDLRMIAARLNVRTVLEGSVRKAGNRIRITAQLINAVDGYHLWSERFDRDLDDIFTVQDEIARTIVEKLKVQLVGDGRQPLVKPPTDDLEAYQLYLQGRYFWSQRGGGLRKGLQCFEAALARDPNYALAHAGVADTYTLLGFYGYGRPNDVMPKARAAAQRALVIDPDLAEAHCALAFILLCYDWNIPAAQREFRRAIELKPTYVPALYWSSSCSIALNRLNESVAIDEEAVRLEPLSLFTNTHLGWMLLGSGRAEEAIPRLEHVLALDAHFLIAHWLLGQSYITVGRTDEGIAELETAVKLSDQLPWMVATLGCALAYIGRVEEARAVLADLTRRAEKEYVRAYLFALLHAYLGEEDVTLIWLEKAREERDLSLSYSFLTIDNFTAMGIQQRFLNPARRAAFIERLGIIRA
ncbi:MAG: TIR domain-containing protein [Opitutaceae bacterium]|nr:TIR domain-containing protein [Opitutaceae bacterium]